MCDRKVNYLKIKDTASTSSFDDMYYEMDPDDNTWENVMSYIETELDAKYVKNDDCLVGVKLEIEIVDKMPEGTEAY